MNLSDIFLPESLSIEDYGHAPQDMRKVFIAGSYFDQRWLELYGDLRPDVREGIQTVDGTVASVQLRRQVAGDHQGKLVAFATPQCHIGSHRLGVVDSLGDCVLPEPFTTLGELSR